MNEKLTELLNLVDAEAALGEELLQNLESQRRSILNWNVSDLIGHIQAREACLRSLAELEDRRGRLLVQWFPTSEQEPTLRELMIRFPQEAGETVRLTRLRVQEIFNRLRTEEAKLLGLTETLLDHIREALTFLAGPTVPLYSESGATMPQRPMSGLIRGKA